MVKGWPFGDLPMFGFDFIMADPPWQFRVWSEKGNAKSPEAQYPTMPLDDIKALPVGHLAAANCVLFLWTTWPVLLDGGDMGAGDFGDPGRSPPGEVMKAWGFRYVTGGAWSKKTRNGKQSFGPGYRVRTACEPFLIGIAGNPETPGATRARNLIEGIAREHSRKPEAVYKWAEDYMPKAQRLDLFSRQKRPGWLNWGNEAELFNGADGAELRSKENGTVGGSLEHAVQHSVGTGTIGGADAQQRDLF